MFHTVKGKKVLFEKSKEKSIAEEFCFDPLWVKYIRQTKNGVEINFLPDFFKISEKQSEKPFRILCEDSGEFDIIKKLIENEHKRNT